MNNLRLVVCLSFAALILALAAVRPAKARLQAPQAASLLQDDGSHERTPVQNDEAGEDSREDGEGGHLNGTLVAFEPAQAGFHPARTFSEPSLHRPEPLLPPPNATSLL